jgi:hypothetical protein
LHAWLNVLDQAAEDVSAERRNLGATVLQIVLKAVHYVYKRAVAVTVENKCATLCANGSMSVL